MILKFLILQHEWTNIASQRDNRWSKIINDINRIDLQSVCHALDLGTGLSAYGGVSSGSRFVAVAGTGVLAALPGGGGGGGGLISEKGLSSPGGQSKTKSAGLAGLDSEAVRRWVAEAARTVRQIPPPVIVPTSTQHLQLHQQLHLHQQQQHHSAGRRQQQHDSAASSILASSFILPTSMTQTPSMHLLENNNLVEVAMAAQQQSHQQQQQNHQSQLQQQREGLIQHQQKQKQTGSPTNNNTIEAWRSIQGGTGITSIGSGHRWWSPPSSVHQEQQQRVSSPIAQASSQAPSLVSGSTSQVSSRHQQQGQSQQVQQQVQQGQQVQAVQSDIDQPLDFSVGSLQQQRLQSRVRSMHERLQQQNRIHDNNNGMSERKRKMAKSPAAGGGVGIGRGTSSRRSYSPASDASTSGSEDEGVSTGGSPSGPLRGAENGES